MKSVSKTKLLELLIKLNKVDQLLYQLLQPDTKYPSQKEGWYFLSYHNILNAIYYEFCGQSKENYYCQFKTTNYDSKELPIAWYETQYSSKNDGSIKGPKEYTGFIPDCINDVTLSYKLTAKEKLKLLNRMFKDLKKLKEEYVKRSSHESLL